MFARAGGMAFRGMARRSRPCGARVMSVSSYAVLAPTRQLSMPPVAVAVANTKLNVSLGEGPCLFYTIKKIVESGMLSSRTFQKKIIHFPAVSLNFGK